jgi:hypothetical protein
MTPRGVWATAVFLWLLPGAVQAQRFEAGGLVGTACQGSEGSNCGSAAWLGEFGGYGSLWLTDNLEAQARVTRVGLDAFDALHEPRGVSPPSILVSYRHRSRVLMGGHLLYHFGRGRLRPSIGLGLGQRQDRAEITCVPAGCEAVADNQRGGSPLGRSTLSGGNFSVSFGLHGRIGSLLVARGGLTFNNFAGEHLATTELTVGVGLRF